MATDPKESGAAPKKRLLYRLVFLVMLGGGLVYWSQRKMPKPLPLVVDLSQSLPGELTGVDIVVTRAGHALARLDKQYPKGAAPERVTLVVRATPGEADVETTLVYPDKPAHRTNGHVTLREDESAQLVAK